MDTPLRFTQPTRSKDLEETRQKHAKSTTSHMIGCQDHHDHLLVLRRCSSPRFPTTWYYNQWSILRIAPSPVTFFYLGGRLWETCVWCVAFSQQRICSQVEHHTNCYSVHRFRRIHSSCIFSRCCTQRLTSVLTCEEFPLLEEF